MSNNISKIHYYLAFIRAYRDLPALWDSSTKDYTNKLKRIEGYEKLLKIYKNVKPNATDDDVKKKINSMRTNFKKQLKKIEASINSGSDEIFQPQCWTFKELSFLIDSSSNVGAYLTENPDKIKKNESEEDCLELDEHEVEDTEFENYDCDIFDETQQISYNYDKAQSSSGRKRKYDEYQKHNQNELLSVVCDYLKKNENDEIVIAKSWALKLARLKSDQKIWAEKFINDILTEGELGTLHRHSVQINESFG